jgi:hypothetical protein
MTKIYLDACCLNRPFDDQTQARIRLEAEAILIILSKCQSKEWEWIGSEVLDLEINQTPDTERKRRMQLLVSHVHQSVAVGQSEIDRAQQFEDWGIPAFDALHLACAENRADIFLTVDDKFLKKSATYSDQLQIKVENPLTWLKETSK